MKSRWLLTLLFVCQAFAEESAVPNLAQLQQRFVTTVVEARIDNQFQNAPQVRQCMEENRITEQDLLPANRQAFEDKRRLAEECVRRQFTGMSPEQLTQLSNTLGLEAFGVVKGKDSQQIVDYFAGRIREAFNGRREESARLRDIKLVDQKTYVDLYQTQLGKSVLLEISQFCSQTLRVRSTSNQRTVADELAQLQSGSQGLQTIVDKIDGADGVLTDEPSTATASAPSSDSNQIYNSFLNQTVGLPTNGPQPTEEQTRQRLVTIFDSCAKVIPLMCEMYEYCRCQQTPGQTTNCVENRFKKSGGQCPPPVNSQPNRIGQAACHTVARLRGYRLNLQATNEVQQKLQQVQGGAELAARGGSPDTYNRANATEGNSLDDLTSLTTTSVDDIIKQDDLDKQAGDIDNQDCANEPENPDCEKTFYTAREGANFANAQLGYKATTEIELQRLEELRTRTNDLETYLTGRGYLDILERFKADGNASAAVNAAKQRLSAERDATMAQMENAFNRRQLVRGDRNNQGKIDEVKAELQNKSREFQELILYNNVISSYLNIQRRTADGRSENVGSNTEALRRELQDTQEAGVGDRLQYFSNFADQESQIRSDENPLVDVSFLDSVLGNTQANTPTQATQSSGGGSRRREVPGSP